MVAVTVNGGAGGALIDDVLAAVLAESADLRLPPRRLPPAEPVPVDAADYAGRYPRRPVPTRSSPPTAAASTSPRSRRAWRSSSARSRSTSRYVALGDDRFVGAERDEGVHAVIAFLRDGRYLYNGRAIPRL